jgi:prepilin-type N-terminal cleavage/methylation domain-containing protein
MSRRAFTLVELLVTIAIIAILAGIGLSALWASGEAAKASRSTRTVTLLHNALAAEWEGYLTRRVPIRRWVYFDFATGTEKPVNPDMNGVSQETEAQFALRRLEAKRQLMRMELPDRYKDLTYSPTIRVTSRRTAYLRRVDLALAKYNAANSLTLTRDAYLSTAHAGKDNQSAECLYLIVTVTLPPENRSVFKASDMGDTDGDQMPEILDGWGNPIEWLRWAPGFNSDAQPLDSSIGAVNPLEHHDPFDPLRLSSSLPTAKNPPPLDSGETAPDAWGFALLPLIVSPGPDKEYGIYLLHDDSQYSKDWNPYSRYKDTNGVYRWRGQPILTGDEQHLDNITNHALAAK